MRLALLLTATTAGLTPACGDDEAGILLVDLRTDFTPGLDFTEIETQIGARPPVRVEVDPAAPFDVGQRIADASSRAPATYDVTVRLFDDAGTAVYDYLCEAR